MKNSSQLLKFTEACMDLASRRVLLYSSKFSNQWVHIVAVFDGTVSPQAKLYVNGDVVVSGTKFGASLSTNDVPIRIGAGSPLPDGSRVFQFFKGIIDDLRLYNRALSEAEVKELFKMGEGKP